MEAKQLADQYRVALQHTTSLLGRSTAAPPSEWMSESLRRPSVRRSVGSRHPSFLLFISVVLRVIGHQIRMSDKQCRLCVCVCQSRMPWALLCWWRINNRTLTRPSERAPCCATTRHIGRSTILSNTFHSKQEPPPPPPLSRSLVR